MTPTDIATPSTQVNPLDNLRILSQEMAVHADLTRRPTWAPALKLTEEPDLAEVLFDLNWLGDDDLVITRLWAFFTTPGRGEVQCEGFQLIAGQEREKRKEIWRAQYADRAITLERLSGYLGNPHISQETLQHSIARWEAKESDWELGPRWPKPEAIRNPQLAERQRLYIRATELGHRLVMKFAGGTDLEIVERMRVGSRLTGRCCNCGRSLTDEISLEYGIGPECRRGRNMKFFPGALWLKVGA